MLQESHQGTRCEQRRSQKQQRSAMDSGQRDIEDILKYEIVAMPDVEADLPYPVCVDDRSVDTLNAMQGDGD